jgi:hypothetical protein
VTHLVIPLLLLFAMVVSTYTFFSWLISHQAAAFIGSF